MLNFQAQENQSSFCFSLEILAPSKSLPLYHVMLGLGFPTTGNVNSFTSPSTTVTFPPVPVASTGSLGKEKNSNKKQMKCRNWNSQIMVTST